MSTLFVNNLNTASGSTITVPTGKKLIVTDSAGLIAPEWLWLGVAMEGDVSSFVWVMALLAWRVARGAVRLCLGVSFTV